MISAGKLGLTATQVEYARATSVDPSGSLLTTKWLAATGEATVAAESESKNEHSKADRQLSNGNLRQ